MIYENIISLFVKAEDEIITWYKGRKHVFEEEGNISYLFETEFGFVPCFFPSILLCFKFEYAIYLHEEFFHLQIKLHTLQLQIDVPPFV